MSPNYRRILEPITIGGLELSNRVVMLPMGTGLRSPEGWLGDREIAYLTERAAGGTALITTGAAPVSIDFEPSSPLTFSVHSDDALPSMTRLAESVHAVGGKLSFQITPGFGRNAGPGEPGRPPICASAVPAFGAPDVMCRALETDEVQLLVQRMAEAAARAAKAGADAIDIHGHTGYLLDQFLSAQWNHREDQYGGSLEDRCRFAVEIIQAVKAAAPGLAVSFRLTMDQRFPGGRGVEESMEIAKILERAGVDFFLADEGSYEAMDYVFPPYYMGDAALLSAAKALKSAVSVPVVACGNLDPATAATVLENGDADLIGVGRGLVADPYYVAKLEADTPEEIRPCIRCNAMCIGLLLSGQPLGCAVNPEAGFELERRIAKTAKPQKVVIVGGGPAGLEAARVASLEGHEVDVYEREDRLGGVLLPAATPEFKRELHRMIDWWEGQLGHLPVRIHLGHEVTADDPALTEADRVLVGTGSVPFAPADIPGSDGPNVVGVIEAHEGARLGKRVLVAGGGLSGADLALELAQKGHEVTIVEMEDEIARDMLILNRMSLLRELNQANVRIRVSHTLTAVNADAVTTSTPDGERVIPTDTVVMALGVNANDALARELRQRGIEVELIGDCAQPAKVGEAIHAGYLAAAGIG